MEYTSTELSTVADVAENIKPVYHEKNNELQKIKYESFLQKSVQFRVSESWEQQKSEQKICVSYDCTYDISTRTVWFMSDTQQYKICRGKKMYKGVPKLNKKADLSLELEKEFKQLCLRGKCGVVLLTSACFLMIVVTLTNSPSHFPK